MPVKFQDVLTQGASLEVLAKCVLEDITSEEVYTAARQITMGCAARDDLCELTAIFDAVKHGTSRVPGMENGLRYVSDPTSRDFFVRPRKMLKQCTIGACAEDCDSHAALVAALAGSIGFRVGVRAYGYKKNGPLEHVYAVALLPKHPMADEFGNPTGSDTRLVGLDTTVNQSRVGWEPPPGRVETAWIFPTGIKMLAGKRA